MISDNSMAAIQAIRDYENMRLILDNTPHEIKERYESLTSPHRGRLDGMPRANNPRAGEDVLVAEIDRLTLMRDRYRKAELFILWFEPMWLALTEQERDILETYKWTDARSGAVSTLASRLSFSPRQLNRMRQKALAKLTKLLFAA